MHAHGTLAVFLLSLLVVSQAVQERNPSVAGSHRQGRVADALRVAREVPAKEANYAGEGPSPAAPEGTKEGDQPEWEGRGILGLANPNNISVTIDSDALTTLLFLVLGAIAVAVITGLLGAGTGLLGGLYGNKSYGTGFSSSGSGYDYGPSSSSSYSVYRSIEEAEKKYQ
ncbi:uncharacterized protein [Panulirus ornatus]|uniref:uncharacterized protein n=1 Tax=Panulirus ornatus TaxID=150431 RepID=UPI003A839E9F